jgi:CheY-like chemotaxis protein
MTLSELPSTNPSTNEKAENALDLVFLVDDDLIFHAITRRLISVYNFARNTESFHDGQAAINSLAQRIVQEGQLPEVIFLDLNMPIMDGWEFLSAYKHLPIPPKPIHIYVVTSSDLASDRLKAETYTQLEGYIVKPITESDFRVVWTTVTSQVKSKRADD